MIKTKKQSMIVVVAFILVLMLFTTTYAFFNYTRTGSSNVIKTGRISFNHTQGNSINLTNMFPIEANATNLEDPTKVGSVTINVTGDTTYSEGIEYKVSAVGVSNSIQDSEKKLPISIDVTVEDNDNNDPATDLGEESNDYFNDRGSSTSYYSIVAGDTIENDGDLLYGYIAPGSTGVDGNIVIKAYIDKAKVVISDTYPTESEDTNNDGYLDGTPTSFGEGKTVFTTTEWNSLQTNGVSFQVKVESRDGTWVKKPVGTATFDIGSTVNTKLKLLMEYGEYRGQNKVNDISYDAFVFARVYDKPDVSTFSSVNILSSTNSEEIIYAWYDEPSPHDNRIYWYTDANMVYLNEDSSNLFRNISGLTLSTGFESIETNHVLDMSYMFSGITEVLSNWGFDKISDWDVSNVTNMSGMFNNCFYVEFSLFQNWNVSNVTNMSKMFASNFNVDSNDSFYVSNYHTNDASSLNDWNISNVTNLDNMFAVKKISINEPLSNYIYPIFRDRPGIWNNDIVTIDGIQYYSGTYVPNN